MSDIFYTNVRTALTAQIIWPIAWSDTYLGRGNVRKYLRPRDNCRGKQSFFVLAGFKKKFFFLHNYVGPRFGRPKIFYPCPFNCSVYLRDCKSEFSFPMIKPHQTSGLRGLKEEVDLEDLDVNKRLKNTYITRTPKWKKSFCKYCSRRLYVWLRFKLLLNYCFPPP